jgi:hypothetical protein
VSEERSDTLDWSRIERGRRSGAAAEDVGGHCDELNTTPAQEKADNFL